MPTDIASLKIKVDTKDFNKASMELDKLEGSGKKAEKSFISLNGATVATVASMYLFQKAISSAISSGLAYNKAVEQAKSGIVALSVAMQDKAIPVQERYRIAQEESIATLKELQKINVQTPHTLEQTNQIYKSMYASMKNMGASTSDMVEITRSMSIAAGAAGIEFNSLLAGVDGLATGTVLANSDLGRFLGSVGLTNDVLKDSDDVVKTITERLKDFKALGTYTEAVSNFDNAWGQLTGKMTADIFEGSKQGLNELSTLLNSMSDDDIDSLKKGMNELGVVALNVVYGTASGVVELTNAFDSLGARIAGVAYRISEGVFLNDEESAALERMYQNTKDNIKAREDFIETLRLSKVAMEDSISASGAKSKDETESKLPSFDINKKSDISEVIDQTAMQTSINDGVLAYNDYIEALGSRRDELLSALFPTEGLEQKFQEQQELLLELNEQGLLSDLEHKVLLEEAEKVHQDKLTDIKEKASKDQEKREKRVSDTIIGMRKSVIMQSAALLDMLAGDSKAAAIASIAIQKGLAISETIMSTEAASMMAMAQLGPLGGGPAAVASIKAMGATSVGIIAASGLLQASSVASGGGGGLNTSSTFGGSNTGPTPESFALTSTEEQTTKEVTINLGDSAFVSTEMVRELVNAINEEIGDGVRINV